MQRLLNKVIDKWPLQKQFGFYAFLPAFFAVGAVMEFTMIIMRINNVDFYSVYMAKERQRLEEEAQVSYHLIFVDKWTVEVVRDHRDPHRRNPGHYHQCTATKGNAQGRDDTR